MTYIPQLSPDADFPVLPLSACFRGYIISNSTLPANGKYVALPEVDKLLTDYFNQTGRSLYTIKFLEVVNQQYSPAGSVIINGKLEYAVNLYEKNCNLTSNAQLGEVRNVLAAYLKSPFDFYDQHETGNLLEIGTAAKLFRQKVQVTLPDLKAAQQTKAKSYQDEIAKLNMPQQKPPVKIGDEHAKWFIDWANQQIENDMKYQFALVSLNAVALSNADEFINDERFRPSAIDPRWNEYDDTIKQEVAFYNQKFAGVAGFIPLDWRYVKAMVWSEVLAGPAGNADQWTRLPMQIGKFDKDKGYVAVRDGKQDEGADLVTPQELRDAIQNKSQMVGKLNVRAEIAYLYIRAIADVKTEDEVEPLILTTVVLKGENGFDAIADRLKITTSNNIEINNRKVDSKKLQIGQEIKYQKAKPIRSVSKWKEWMEAIRIYNIGDPDGYIPKVQRAYQIIISRTPR